MTRYGRYLASDDDMIIHHRLIVALSMLVIMAGCTLEPAYQRPDSGVDPAWPTDHRDAGHQPSSGEIKTSTADIGWRQFFTDPQLQQLIETALANNRDLRVAILNIEAARAQYRIQRSDLFPAIDADAGEQVQRDPPGVGSAVGQSHGNVSRDFSVGIGFTSYELDLFGRIRSLNHAALEQYFSQIETRRSVQISLVAEVANDYLSLLSDQALLKLAHDTYDNQQSAYDLIQHSYDLGVANALDLSQAEQTLDTARADIARYMRLVAQDRNALRLSLGAPLPDNLPPDTDLDHELLLDDLQPGLPSDVLLRRPDVLAAERRLIAANANIGAARAAFFPSISLTGSFGSASAQLNGLFKDGSEAWTFSPQISLPIFAAGANAANLDLAKIEKNVYIAQYQKAIQTAFREVADALAARGTFDQQIAAERRLVESAKTSFTLSNMRFQQGVDSYLGVLDAQRTLYAAQTNLIGTRLVRLQNLVTLYKALGGGWSADTIKGEPQSTTH